MPSERWSCVFIKLEIKINSWYNIVVFVMFFFVGEKGNKKETLPPVKRMS